jgi:multicomponent Na+:H+ antiporter subunit E
MIRAVASRLPVVVWLLAVWLMLWGSLAPAVVLFGLLLSVGVVALFRLPAIRGRLTVRPQWLLLLLGYLVMDLVTSSVEIGWHAARYGRGIRAAVIRVPLLSDVEPVIVLAANLCSFGPGKFVLQIDREGGAFYVYGFPARSPAERGRMYDEVMKLQRIVLRAFAPKDEVRALDGSRR